MKRAFHVLIIAALAASLTACGGTPSSSSQNAGVSSESSSENAPSSSSFGHQEEDVNTFLTGQMEEIQSAVEPISPKREMLSETEREAVGQRIADAIAGLDYPVWQYHEDMPNYEQVTAFFERLQSGENTFVAVVNFNTLYSIGITSTIYGKDSEGLFTCGAHIYQNDNFEWENVVYDRVPLHSLELTPNGNLLASYGEDSFEDGMAAGFRVIPQEKEYSDAYDKYVRLVDVQSDGILSNAWSMESGFRELPWELIFEEIWERENKQILIAEDNPYYTQIETEYGGDYVAVVPASVVEGTLQKHFDIDADTLHGMKSDISDEPLYSSADDTYTIWGFQGGGYKPTLEVCGITDNPDGSITLDIRSVALDFGDDGHITNYLTITPQPDGGYRYISNTRPKE